MVNSQVNAFSQEAIDLHSSNKHFLTADYAVLMNLLDKPKTLSSLSEEMRQEYITSTNAICLNVEELLTEMIQRNMIIVI